MNDEPKTLEKGESAYRNGGGCICGGVISQSTFDSNPWAYMMCWVMSDENFEIYKSLTKLNNKKLASEFRKEYARSMI